MKTISIGCLTAQLLLTSATNENACVGNTCHADGDAVAQLQVALQTDATEHEDAETHNVVVSNSSVRYPIFDFYTAVAVADWVGGVVKGAIADGARYGSCEVKLNKKDKEKSECAFIKSWDCAGNDYLVEEEQDEPWTEESCCARCYKHRQAGGCLAWVVGWDEVGIPFFGRKNVTKCWLKKNVAHGFTCRAHSRRTFGWLLDEKKVKTTDHAKYETIGGTIVDGLFTILPPPVPVSIAAHAAKWLFGIVLGVESGTCDTKLGKCAYKKRWDCAGNDLKTHTDLEGEWDEERCCDICYKTAGCYAWALGPKRGIFQNGILGAGTTHCWLKSAAALESDCGARTDRTFGWLLDEKKDSKK